MRDLPWVLPGLIATLMNPITWVFIGIGVVVAILHHKDKTKKSSDK